MHRSEKEFEIIFLSTKERLYGYIKKFVESDQDAKDILQQCYIRLWLRIDEITDTDNVIHLLYTYSKNLLIDTSRKLAVEKKNLREYGYLLSDMEPARLPGSGDVSDEMNKALLRMPERKRTIFLMRKDEGLTAIEIAERLNITPRVVRRHLEEAIYFLKNHISATELLALLVYSSSLTTCMLDSH